LAELSTLIEEEGESAEEQYIKRSRYVRAASWLKLSTRDT